MPPSPTQPTPFGTSAIEEVAGAGVTSLVVGPWGREWVDADLADVAAANAAAAARGVHTWVHLRELARAAPGSPQEERLTEVLETFRGDPAVAMWMGVDEPWWSGHPAPSLEHAYGLTRAADPHRLLFLNQAPRGTAADLSPYAALTDVHSVDIYPVKYVRRANPNLHAVGIWTQRLAAVTPSRAVLTMLQVCFSGSDDPAGSGAYVVPTLAQARYMAYDAIMNGARGLSFYGGHVKLCLSPEDALYGWNWAYWSTVLKPLLREIGPRSRLYPFLLAPGKELRIRSDHPKTPVIARRVGREVWVVAARYGAGTGSVRISGLPRNLVPRGWVYREGRRITVRNGALTDSFARWDVHVYRFRVR